jgi:hypothetical protein
VETLEELNALSNQPLDISQAPLARLICRSSSDDSEIILIIDHAISDGQTVRVLLRMLECVLADEPMLEVNSGHDFIRGEWEAIGDSCLRRRALEHWQKLGGSYPPLTRQEPFAGADQIDMRIAKIYIAFCQEAVDAIDGPAALLASVSRAVALESPTHCGRKSGMDVSWIGVSSRRGRPSHQKILGCLANWIGIGLRIDVSKQFASGVTQARRALVEAMRHQRIAHAEVVRSLDPSIYGERWRDGSTVPRYGIFNYRAPDPTLQILGDRGRFVQPDLKPTAHGCLRVDAIPSLEDGGIRVLLQVDQNIFGSSFVDTMLTELDRTSIFHVGGEYPGLSQ